MLEFALQYAARGWRVFPVHGFVDGRCTCGKAGCTDPAKHPRIKAWQKQATAAPGQVERWFTRWPDSNIGIATGGGLVVQDLDSLAEMQALAKLAAGHGGLPATLTSQTGRGLHLWFAGDLPASRKVDGLLVRGNGGFVIAPPSLHASGKRYKWLKELPIARVPAWYQEWALTGGKQKTNGALVHSPLVMNGTPLPAYILNKTNSLSQQNNPKTEALESTLKEPWSPAIEARVRSALKVLPANCARDPWLHIGMALHSCAWWRPDGTDAGYDLWAQWSETGGEKYQGPADLETRWKSFGTRHGITLGTLFHMAEQAGWQGYVPEFREEVMPHSTVSARESGAFDDKTRPPLPIFTPAAGTQPQTGYQGEPIHPVENVLAEMNKTYSVIGNVGGKCMVLSFVPSRIDAGVLVPSFQSFKTFQDRYSHRRATIRVEKDGEWVEKTEPLGTSWLKWRHRKTFEGLDLEPGQPGLLPGNRLNLWAGFAVPPVPGSWRLMQRHILEVLANGDAAAARYIVNWAAWAVQHPDQPGQAALIFRGGKGAGKGVFARALRQLFGQHGLQVWHSKHVVGNFNAHLRSCLLLYADEAFWAGDRKGEATLKGLITEPVIPIEQKGMDVEPWKNRIHLVMTANAEWVVPASADERRYAAFDVSEKHTRNKKYFDALYQELKNGGLSAMLHDLLKMDLGTWTPRDIIETESLRMQKERSMAPLEEWWEALLQDGILPYVSKETPHIGAAAVLLEHARAFTPRMKDITSTALGRFIRAHGGVKLHKAQGNSWKLPPLSEARQRWEARFNGWRWDESMVEWQVRN